MTAKEIRKKIKALGNAERAAACRRYFKTAPGQYGEGDIFYGLNARQMHTLAREYQAMALDEVMDLLQSPIHEERAIALLILVRAFARGDEATRQQIYELYLQHTQFINNWDLVDSSAAQIVGAYLQTRSRKPLFLLAKSPSLWERRIAMIATFTFIRQNDFHDALKIARLLLSDGEDLIHKAVGWMLREIGKRNQEVEETFLLEHYQRMPRTMLRYAIERFAEPRRQMYLRGQL